MPELILDVLLFEESLVFTRATELLLIPSPF